mmetsp:Transcript_19648/g.35046  ORF Transcript_19648/g.35046 Transcript_19648/m.35046 type:complete len:260 (-) Transcript_19648:182-961(-)
MTKNDATFRKKVVVLVCARVGPLSMELVRMLAKKHARLIIAGSDRTRLEVCVSEAMRFGGDAICCPLDLRDGGAMVPTLPVQALEAFGGIDFLILNTSELDMVSPFIKWDGLHTNIGMLSRHVAMPAYITQLFLPHLIASKGCIMTLTRSTTRDMHPCSAALQGFFQGIGCEFQNTSVPVHVVSVQIAASGERKTNAAAATIAARRAVRALASRSSSSVLVEDSTYLHSLRTFCRYFYPKWLLDALYCPCRRAKAKKMQ